MANSPLVTYTKLSPNHSGKRTQPVWIFTPHCVVGHATLQGLGDLFARPSRQASSNYGIDDDGNVGMFCEEANRSWCTSSSWNDQRAITVEVASDTVSPWAFTQGAYDGLVRLAVDVCKRYGKTRLIWPGSLDRLKLYEQSRLPTDMVLSAHRFFANTGCPGDWFYAREAQFAKEVTEKLGGAYTTPATDELYRVRRSWDDATTQIGAYSILENAKKAVDQNPGYHVYDSTGRTVYPVSEYLVRVSVHDLNIRSGHGTDHPIIGTMNPGLYTIVEEATGQGAKLWGRLKSGAGWIALDYTLRI